MIRLYKDIGGVLHYWETWEVSKNSATTHWGVVGEKGETNEITLRLLKAHHKIIEKEIKERIEEGFREIEPEDQDVLIIEYKIEGMGTEADLKKRYELESALQEILGWTGVGHCDGGSIGSGTMEVCCYVVDFNIAKKVIAEALKGTKFQDYARIFKEE